jgi:hypothetical protein
VPDPLPVFLCKSSYRYHTLPSRLI